MKASRAYGLFSAEESCFSQRCENQEDAEAFNGPLSIGGCWIADCLAVIGPDQKLVRIVEATEYNSTDQYRAVLLDRFELSIRGRQPDSVRGVFHAVGRKL